jgi:hypothetical protein
VSRIVTLIALALAAAAVAASIATADTGSQAGTTVDPLAVSMLLGKGYTPQQVEAWTVGACSHAQKPADCFGPSKGANLEGSAARVDPLAQSYLLGRGLSPHEVTSWTTGNCSHESKDASCYAMLDHTAATRAVDPLAVSYLSGQGLTPAEVASWTTGSCSHEVKATSCYAMFEPTATVATRSIGFSWGDAGIGAAATLGIVLLLAGLGAAFVSRHNRPDHTAHA